MATIVRLAVPQTATGAGWAERVLFVLWLALVMLAPVWFGSVLPLVWGVHALILGGILMAFGITTAISGVPLPVPLPRLFWPLTAIGLVLLWAFLQTSAYVPLAWQHPVWQLAGPVIGKNPPGAMSVDPEATWNALIWTATVAANLFLAMQFARRPGRSWTILFALVLSAGAIALYGLIVFQLGNHWVLWVPKFAYLNALTATFVNRNNYAAYAGISLVCTIGLILRSLGSDGYGARAQISRVFMLLLLGGIALLLCMALALTGSRAGAAVTLLGIGVVALLQLLLRSRLWGLVVIGFIIAAGLAIFALPIGHLAIARLANFDQDVAARFAVDQRVVDAIGVSPWVGYGFGAFKQAFPMFRDWTITPNAIWEYAHDDWLEALFTLGIPVGLLLWFVTLWALARCLGGIRVNRRDSIYAVIAAGACTLAMAHSLVDFSAQIQGFAIPLTAIIGVGIVQSWTIVDRTSERLQRRRRLSTPRKPSELRPELPM